MNIKWNAENYRDNFSFVYEYGEELTGMFTLGRGSRIADVGCGSGALTRKLCDMGYEVIGIDSSAEMLSLAKSTAPAASFMLADAAKFSLEKTRRRNFFKRSLSLDRRPFRTRQKPCCQPARGRRAGVRVRRQGLCRGRTFRARKHFCRAWPFIPPHVQLSVDWQFRARVGGRGAYARILFTVPPPHAAEGVGRAEKLDSHLP